MTPKLDARPFIIVSGELLARSPIGNANGSGRLFAGEKTGALRTARAWEPGRGMPSRIAAARASVSSSRGES